MPVYNRLWKETEELSLAVPDAFYDSDEDGDADDIEFV